MNVKHIPTSESLTIVTRNKNLETLHYGWVCILNKDKSIFYQKGNLNTQIFMRSSAKPVQAVPIVETQLDVSDIELAIICGSHSGSKRHINVLKEIMKRYNLHSKDLQCGIHMPFDETETKKLIRNKIKPSTLHNNCSGKHIGMLSLCKTKNWDIKNYLSLNHPLQQRIKNLIFEMSETKKLSTAIDGCGVPTFSIPVINIAKLFSNFTSNKNYPCEKIIRAMKKHPFYMGGYNQIDSEIITASNKKLIAKVGAEGIIIVADRGKALVVKIADGSARIRSFVTVTLLTKLGWLKKSDIEDTILSKILKGEVINHSGKVVGKIVSLL